MTELLRQELAHGGSVLVEIADDEPGALPASRVGDYVQSAAGSLAAALTGVRGAAAEACRQFRETDVRPPPGGRQTVPRNARQLGGFGGLPTDDRAEVRRPRLWPQRQQPVVPAARATGPAASPPE
ncbi:MAG TPA: hypothetical protein VFW65_23160 [Pseudonocardiaceae bacterium]|nr:hypothetical protein [Pseudonocardiaceae bacterium]